MIQALEEDASPNKVIVETKFDPRISISTILSLNSYQTQGKNSQKVTEGALERQRT